MSYTSDDWVGIAITIAIPIAVAFMMYAFP